MASEYTESTGTESNDTEYNGRECSVSCTDTEYNGSAFLIVDILIVY